MTWIFIKQNLRFFHFFWFLVTSLRNRNNDYKFGIFFNQMKVIELIFHKSFCQFSEQIVLFLFMRESTMCRSSSDITIRTTFPSHNSCYFHVIAPLGINITMTISSVSFISGTHEKRKPYPHIRTGTGGWRDSGPENGIINPFIWWKCSKS